MLGQLSYEGEWGIDADEESNPVPPILVGALPLDHRMRFADHPGPVRMRRWLPDASMLLSAVTREPADTVRDPYRLIPEGASSGTRTPDRPIKSRLLYQLS